MAAAVRRFLRGNASIVIGFDEAYRVLIESARPLPSERVPLRETLGRVLAADIYSDVAMPAFDKSMVDGFACRRADLKKPLECVETVAAGHPPTERVGEGQCAKIMTGAEMPDGADMVFLVEHSEIGEDGLVRFSGEESGDNIARRGADVTHGQLVFKRGDRVSPQDIAMLASVGAANPEVSVRPRVAIIATGDELVEPDETPGPSQIRNSNAYQLEAQVRAVGAEPVSISVAKDTSESLEAALESAMRAAEVILFSGGVSMGEFDLVPGVIKDHEFEVLFEKIRIQPGKPTVFAKTSGHWLLGLPGNPVSTFVIFELLARPFLLALMGHVYAPVVVQTRLATAFKRKNASRKAWVPVRMTEEGLAARVDYHGSGHIHAYGAAEGMIAFPEGVHELGEGDVVRVRLLDTR